MSEAVGMSTQRPNRPLEKPPVAATSETTMPKTEAQVRIEALRQRILESGGDMRGYAGMGGIGDD